MTEFDARTWSSVLALIREWRAIDDRRHECVRTFDCLRPEGHDGECWPQEGKL